MSGIRATYERVHWSVFNVFVRFFGIMSAIGALSFAGWGVVFAIYPERAKESSMTGSEAIVTHLIGAILCSVMALASLRTRAYRPDLGDPTWSFRRKRSPVDSSQTTIRSWWTGEPKPRKAERQRPNAEG